MEQSLPHTLVVDFDDTICDKPKSGLFPKVSDGPCWKPLLEWFSLGGNVFVVTTTSRRILNQFCGEIPEQYRPQTMISVSGGCSLIRYDPVKKDYFEDTDFSENVIEGGTWIADSICQEIIQETQDILVRLFFEIKEDPLLIKKLSTKYHEPYTEIYEKIAHISDKKEVEDIVRSVFSPENMMNYGNIMKKTNEVFLSFNASIFCNHSRVYNIGVMGIFPSIANKIVNLDFFTSRGLIAEFAPNSVWISKKTVNKGLPIQWVAQHFPKFLDLNSSIAFADSPSKNDFPLTCFVEKGMPFVSVEEKKTFDCPYYIGGLALGSSFLIQELCQCLRKGTYSKENLTDIVKRCCEKIQRKVEE